MDTEDADLFTSSETVVIEQIRIQGLLRTTERTITDLLVQRVPGSFSPAEIAEFERRIRNLSIFDHVSITIHEQVLTIQVSEKFMLAPILNFTSGSSPQDLNATAGLVEYNLGGTGSVGWAVQLQSAGTQCRYLAVLPQFPPDAMGQSGQRLVHVNGIRFADSSTQWNRNRIGGELESKAPIPIGPPCATRWCSNSTGN
jgi:outer membrane protein assembly factor BamA